MTTVTRTMPASVARVAAAGRTWATDMRFAGSLLTVAGVTILLGIITAEALYSSAYTTGGSEISDLGGTRPPNSLIFQPSAMIFDLSMVAIGILVLAGSGFVHRVFGRRSVTIPLTVLGIGALGVGLFPGNTGAPHQIFAMTTFIAGGVAAVSAARVTTAPFRFVSLLLGAVSLVTLISTLLLGNGSPMTVLGIGGIERWIVYPVILWIIAFGGYLSGRADGDRTAGAA
jgi:hypothetical membrane protein